MKPRLLIIAAGLGTRYGGLKQIDSVGPNGEIIIDYSIYDALSAGFGKLVFVIRRCFEDAFREKIGKQFEGVVETAYAYQELETGLGDFQLQIARRKPWGTAHAVLVARDVIGEPFAVINADDYYGPYAFRAMADYLSPNEARAPTDYAMVGYVLRNTLSEYGPVARGVCQVDGQMWLKQVTECIGVERDGDGAAYAGQDGRIRLTGDEIVSMNLWGFTPSIFPHLEGQFHRFLAEQGTDPRAECFIPTVVDHLVQSGQARVKVLMTEDAWFGITYKRDRDIVARKILELIDLGVYPARLPSS